MAEIRVEPAPLLLLADRMKMASEDLAYDVVEIQYLLSKFGDTISGEEFTQTIDGAKSEVERCKQLCDTLNGISSDLRKIYAEYLNAEQAMLERINQSLRNNVT